MRLITKALFKRIGAVSAHYRSRRPMVSQAKKSISAFKLRKGMPIGVKVTLRGSGMFEFWNKLVTIVLPRQRDFKGISHHCFDGREI